jgi:hypothetical protein
VTDSEQPGAQAAPRSDAGAGDQQLWRDLLVLIEAGQVVPIVGRELLQVDRPAGPLLLTQWCAEQLAAALGVPADGLTSGDPLNTVACRYLATRPDERGIYINLFRVHQQLAQLGIPRPLRQLAAIDNFKLFVTTTFDASLARAINEARFGGNALTEVRAYSPVAGDAQDLPGRIEDLQRPLVFHLLGKVSPNPNYVVTEEDALEFLHSLQSSTRPTNLFSELHRKDLLLIGCRFPSWLVRFFIRIARQERLRLAQGNTVFLVDTGARGDRALIDFLRAFKTRTEVFEHEGPIEFVGELHERWQQRRAEGDHGERPVLQEEPIKPGSIFISYASQDRPVVETIVERLDAAKLDVWFDRQQLTWGDRFEDRIAGNIDNCSLFLPVLSRSCLDPNDRFFRLEWDAAIRRRRMMPPTRPFIGPVVIDDVSPNSEAIHREIRQLHWVSIRDGLTDAFVDEVRQLYRMNQTA